MKEAIYCVLVVAIGLSDAVSYLDHIATSVSSHGKYKIIVGVTRSIIEGNSA